MVRAKRICHKVFACWLARIQSRASNSNETSKRQGVTKNWMARKVFQTTPRNNVKGYITYSSQIYVCLCTYIWEDVRYHVFTDIRHP